MAQSRIVLCAPVRTAIGTYGGSLKEIPAPDLGCAVIKETLSRAKPRQRAPQRCHPVHRRRPGGRARDRGRTLTDRPMTGQGKLPGSTKET